MPPVAGWGSVACQRLTENIIVLGILTSQQAGQPSENKIPLGNTSSRQLPIERERDLVHMFAFLSATRDDPKRVMAVCLEEHVQKQAMTIKVAANTGDLSDVKEGLKKVARILESISKRSQSTIKGRDLLLQQIVRMDQARILSRLCIDHKHSHRWKMGKVFPFSRLRGLLSNALNACSPLDSSTTQGDALIRMNEIELLHADISRRVGKDKSQEPMHASMVKLLKLCNSLTAQVYSKSGLHQKTYIEDQMAFEKFKKLGRYCSISQDLTKAARSSRYEVFDHIKVEVVKICPSWSVKPKSPVSLTASLESACGPAKAQTAKDLVKSYVQNPSGKDTYHQKQAELNQELSRAPKSWKVHAEIQLLLHYELHPSLQKPRVISSNKDACYLCNLFVKTHNTYHIPKTHGKLYDTWCFPDLKAKLEPGANLGPKSLRRLNGVVERFNALLEERIRLILSGAKFFYQLGNVESTLLPYHTWSASVSSHGGSVSAVAAALGAIDSPSKALKIAPPLEDSKSTAKRPKVSVKAVAGPEPGTIHSEEPKSDRVEDREASTTPVKQRDSQAKVDIVNESSPAELADKEKSKSSLGAATEYEGEHLREAVDQIAAQGPQASYPGLEYYHQANQSPLQQHSKGVLDDSSLTRVPMSRPQTPSMLADDPVPQEVRLLPREVTLTTPPTTATKPVNADTTRTHPIADVDALKHTKASPWYALAKPESSLTFSSPSLELDLSQMWDGQTSRTTWVRARLVVLAKEDTGDGKGDVVDARALPCNENVVVTRGSALSGDVLYISAGNEVVAVQYCYEGSVAL